MSGFDGLHLRDSSGSFGVTKWSQYAVDLAQRSALFMQALVERGDQILADEGDALPMRLAFPYQVVMDGSQFTEPANYVLLRILADGNPCLKACEGKQSRPIIVFDPRAGHGPGLAGFREDSEIGMALHRGHPVYFVGHRMRPCPGQTLVRVHHALRRFVEEVAQRHAGQRPVLYGNCQAGWAVALLAADCAGVTGPTVLNGAPLSYWGGDDGVNPMRLAGGLTGGLWATRLLADLSAGEFDGAWLVCNFEQLDPGHAWIGKYRRMWADPEVERSRFLDFERWWGEYCTFTRDEIVEIVENLFIGNRLEQGGFRICECCHVDLRRLRSPMLIFASSGDNITPPQQALGWIPTVWPTTKALVRDGQRICYLLHPDIGHLGIFVSAQVARREHQAIMENLDALEALKPGLYEMRIGASAEGDCPEPRHQVRFEPRRVEDLSPLEDSTSFERVRVLSQALDRCYQGTWGVLAAAMSAATAPFGPYLRLAHPMRASRWGWAHRFNPAANVIDLQAAWARALRVHVEPDNPWRQAEDGSLDILSGMFDGARRLRDQWAESLFASVYGPAAGAAWVWAEPTAPPPPQEEAETSCASCGSKSVDSSRPATTGRRSDLLARCHGDIEAHPLIPSR